MALEQIPTSVPSEEVTEDVKNSDELNNLKDAPDSTNKGVVGLNNNPKLAKEEADRIVEGLPKTIDQLSPQQQQLFIKYVEKDISGLSLNFAPKDAESVPEIIPNDWQQQIVSYKNIRNNISQLPPDKQEALKQAEKEAISKITEDASDVIDADN